jgi:predicted transcriptional regulator
MIHEKKILPEYFQKILDGTKKYELRLADWECNIWDTLVLLECYPESQKPTGRYIRKEVTDVRRTKDLQFYSREDIEKYGYQIISFE